MTDIHALIRQFLQQQTIVPLAEKSPLPADDYTKSGVVPFIFEDGEFRFYVMKPRGHIPGLGEPTFQVCKGTRMHYQKEIGWRDMSSSGAGGEKEALAETAIREGIEEIGLKLDNLQKLYDMGGFSFSSATTGRGKYMWLFAAAVESEDDFLRDAEVALGTAERRWVTTQEFDVVGRDDHRYILKAIETRLRAHLKE